MAKKRSKTAGDKLRDRLSAGKESLPRQDPAHAHAEAPPGEGVNARKPAAQVAIRGLTGAGRPPRL
jgi:hypothetical protein